MIDIRRSDDRGYADHGWLQARHTFSFANYYDPEFMGCSVLRVINQDRVQPGQGFGTHGHENMEIVTYVLDGAVEHKDSMGNGSVIRPGEVQFMSAGTGVTHSEFNASDAEPLHLLQMWIEPAATGYTPRYDQRAFPEAERSGTFRLVVSPDGREGSLSIGQDVCLYAGLLDGAGSAELTLAPGRRAWFHLARGNATLNRYALAPGDGAAIRDETELTVTGGTNAEFLLWDLPG